MTPHQFWAWFQNHQHKYYILALLSYQDQKNYVQTLDKHLKSYCKGLGFLILFDNKYVGPATLIITAYGVKELFPEVRRLVDHAPKIDKWNVEALIKPLNGNLIVNDEPYVFGNIKIKLSDLSFQPVKYIKSTGKIIIHVYFDKRNQLIRSSKKLGTSNFVHPKDLRTIIIFILEDFLGEELLYSRIKNFKVYKNNRNRGITYKLSHLKVYLDLLNRN